LDEEEIEFLEDAAQNIELAWSLLESEWGENMPSCAMEISITVGGVAPERQPIICENCSPPSSIRP